MVAERGIKNKTYAAKNKTITVQYALINIGALEGELVHSCLTQVTQRYLLVQIAEKKKAP